MMHRVNTCSGFSSFYKKYRSSAKGVIMTTTGYDTYRESVAGRADVADTPELVAYYRELERLKTAGRRVIYLDNPGRRDVAAAVGWLYSGLQVMHPGEAASAHAHSTSALRFIMEGRGAYTIVDGHKMTLGANDFVLTPNGCWHEHGVEADGLTCIWQDGLDIPLVNALEAGFFVVHPDLHQAVEHPVDASVALWGAPGLRPQDVKWNKPYS